MLRQARRPVEAASAGQQDRSLYSNTKFRFQVSDLWCKLLDGKIQIISTKFFTLLNNSMNKVTIFVIKDHSIYC
jgi:hypothetical protein